MVGGRGWRRGPQSQSGAADVVVDPAFLAHRAVAMLGVHVQPELPRGVVSARGGAVNASADEVDVVVTGRGGHGGYPHRTADPVLALAAGLTSVLMVLPAPTYADATAPRPQQHGRWLLDGQGRVRIDHGVNMVFKRAPYAPDATGFGADDARFLQRNGFTTVRLLGILEDSSCFGGDGGGAN